MSDFFSSAIFEFFLDTSPPSHSLKGFSPRLLVLCIFKGMTYLMKAVRPGAHEGEGRPAGKQYKIDWPAGRLAKICRDRSIQSTPHHRCLIINTSPSIRRCLFIDASSSFPHHRRIVIDASSSMPPQRYRATDASSPHH